METKTVKFEITVEGIPNGLDGAIIKKLLNTRFVHAVEHAGLRCLILVEEVQPESEAQDERKAVE